MIMPLTYRVPSGRRSLPVVWRDCAWTPQLVLRPGGPIFESLVGLNRSGARNYRRLLNGNRLRSLKRRWRRNRSLRFGRFS